MIEHLNHPVFKIVSEIAAGKKLPCYVIGGYVRDIYLQRKSKDIDFVVLGNGIEMAKETAKRLGNVNVSIYKNFGTAMIRDNDFEFEFVGARKESYRNNSRKPVVENGSLEDDQKRRDFTINALAISLNKENYGEVIDPFNGLTDLKNRILRTPLDPARTYSDDPLRMMRAIRFATTLNFSIEEKSFQAIKNNNQRIKIVSPERIVDELNNIMMAPAPSKGFRILDKTGLLEYVLPELNNLKGYDVIEGKAHKDNFLHTIKVLDNVAKKSGNIWLRWAALLHDIGKPATKKYMPETGWTFHGHDYLGSKMIPRIFKKLKLPLGPSMKYVKKLVALHLRPIALAQEEVTDSAVRRLLFDAGDDIDDLMILCEADITSKNEMKVKKFLNNFALVRQKLKEIEEKDAVRNFQPPVSGELIMETFGIGPSREIGVIKNTIKEAILDGKIRNNHEEACRLMLEKGREMGLTPVKKAQS